MHVNFHMHSVYASKEVLKIRLRCNPSTKIEKPKMLKGGVTFSLKITCNDIFLESEMIA